MHSHGGGVCAGTTQIFFFLKDMIPSWCQTEAWVDLQLLGQQPPLRLQVCVTMLRFILYCRLNPGFRYTRQALGPLNTFQVLKETAHTGHPAKLKLEF